MRAIVAVAALLAVWIIVGDEIVGWALAAVWLVYGIIATLRE